MENEFPLPQPAADPREDRGDVTRQKLLTASIDVFGRLGFDGTTTRALATAAEVNLQAIPYYFGSKEGLYIAVADHIASAIVHRVGDVRDHARSRFSEAAERGVCVTADEARDLLIRILQAMAELFVSRESEPWARIMIREQMQPTEAFERIYGSVMKPLLETIRMLVAILLADNPASERVKLRTLALVGSIMVFRVAHAAVLAQLEWETVGSQQVEAVKILARDMVASLGRNGVGA
jgi:AcrR family transcriptional regulator